VRGVTTARKVALATALGTAWGCGGAGGDARPKAQDGGRVNAVVPKAGAKVDLAEFCETQHTADKAAARPSGSWRWINVWATWCKPCIEELPLLAKWRERLKNEGLVADIEFLSVDGEAELVQKFRADHPGVPETLRIADAAALPGWLGGLGIDASAVLPIHLFVDPADRLRCVRMGGVGARDWDFVKRILSQE
jgi:thiol-disulfide isomerase/thioredoxin